MPAIASQMLPSRYPRTTGSTDAHQWRQWLVRLLLITIVLGNGGCSSLKNTFAFLPFVGEDTVVEESVTSLTQQGMQAYQEGDYYNALEYFTKILDQYPFSPQAMLAGLKAADCHYYREEYTEAKSLYQEFEEQHPSNEVIPYVIYQIGMCDFNRTDRVDRDTSGAREAIKSFSRLLRSYPKSPYAAEARDRIKACRDFLVNHDYFVAVFYVRTREYDQAQHRLKYILNTYPDSSIAPKAKALLARLEAGNPPRWGLWRWLPGLHMPKLHFWESSEEPEKTTKPPTN